MLRYSIHGKRHDMSIDLDGLADARAEAVLLKRLVRQGVDPIAKRAAEKEAARIEATKAKAAEKTFGECVKDYIATHRAGRTPALCERLGSEP
jgi:hypothetical protein